MSEIMRPWSFAELFGFLLAELAGSGSVFGVRAQKFYRRSSGCGAEGAGARQAERLAGHADGWQAEYAGARLDSPVGPAAGPQTQLAPNIIAAYLAGGRVIELKTVQALDGAGLRSLIPRPCINAADECYNVEWSSELTVEEAADEYIKAWIAVHVLAKELDLGDGVVFNMSIGYDLAGIQSAKIDNYLNTLGNAAQTAVWQEALAWLEGHIGLFSRFTLADMAALPSQVSNSVTLSTMHGCPSAEIERIALYLLEAKHLHTSVKMNPTLLGYESARGLLDALGYTYVAFDEHHFQEDLQFSEAVSMIRRLQAAGGRLGLEFGVKLTNTFPVQVRQAELPGDEMYMSGRALFALSVTVADRLAQELGAGLRISYSGGADAFNLADLLRTGIYPVTLATSLLKPGGYERLTQLAKIAEAAEWPAHVARPVTQGDGAPVLPAILAPPAWSGLDLAALHDLAVSVTGRERLAKGYRGSAPRKSERALALVDCLAAPCSVDGCPIGQQIPAYLERVARGDFAGALAVIVNDNVLPSMTGAICHQACQTSCTRLDYDDPVQIRRAKKAAVEAAAEDYLRALEPTPLRSSEPVLVIGAGPAGLSAASYLRRNGLEVTVREVRAQAGGIVAALIPGFRISTAEHELDWRLASAYGVRFEFGANPAYDLQKLRQKYRFVIIATGAWLPGSGLDGLPVDGVRVYDALDFLERSKASGLRLDLGKRVAVVGGGDVAMDCARAALRNSGVEAATVVYRRSHRELPAQAEELELALAEGVGLVELAAPVALTNGALTIAQMRLGEPDSTGRAQPVATGEQVQLPFDTVILATGSRVDRSLMAANGLDPDERGGLRLNAQLEASLPGVYLAGDCRSGPQTIVQAMADAKCVAVDILAKLGLPSDFEVYPATVCRAERLAQKGILLAGVGVDGDDGDGRGGQVGAEAARCLGCHDVCELCVDVCPNRANLAIDLGTAHATGQRIQIIHLDRLCNECGNCATFCPTGGLPYKQKFTVFSRLEDFEESQGVGFWATTEGGYRLRLPDGSIQEWSLPKGGQSPDQSLLPNDWPVGFAEILAMVVRSYRWVFDSDGRLACGINAARATETTAAAADAVATDATGVTADIAAKKGEK